MSGRILILDELATNRIVLKVKLSSAYYSVLQAETGQQALDLASREAPDLILASAALSDMEATGFLSMLRTREETAHTPVVMIQADASDDRRVALLQAGANDVMVKPVQETLLLARLRSLLRQSHSDQDLRVNAGTAQALGFADAARSFRCRGRIALVAAERTAAMHMRARLMADDEQQFVPLAAEQAVAPPAGTPRPEVFVLRIERDDQEAGLRLMAELRAAPNSRNCPVILAFDEDKNGIAATALDMGADDVVTGTVTAQEMRLRISAQLRKKRTTDRMRNQLKTGLHAAVVDPLTGLYNRRYALPFLERLISKSWKGGKPFAVMVADLDHFKQVNDRFGHGAGDAVLTRVAQELRNQVGEGDMVARIGGEEFLIVVPDTTRAEARQTACRLCRVIRATPINVPGATEPLHITVSIGATMGIPQPGPVPRVEALLDQADRALYGAKADGRNTVTLSARTAA